MFSCLCFPCQMIFNMLLVSLIIIHTFLFRHKGVTSALHLAMNVLICVLGEWRMCKWSDDRWCCYESRPLTYWKHCLCRKELSCVWPSFAWTCAPGLLLSECVHACLNILLSVLSKSKYLLKAYNKRIRTVQCGYMQTESITKTWTDNL